MTMMKNHDKLMRCETTKMKCIIKKNMWKTIRKSDQKKMTQKLSSAKT